MAGDASNKRRLAPNVDNLEGGARLGFAVSNPTDTNAVFWRIAVSRFRIGRTDFRIAAG
jgi:hypothetical protein